MKTVRIWFKKSDTAKYISHLDLNRCMTRVIKKSNLPVWWTEGYNPHLFIAFSLPLSLGFSSDYESMDIKILDENIKKEEILISLNSCLPNGIEAFDVTEPKMKPQDIASALFEINITSDINSPEAVYNTFKAVLESPEIIVTKKTKAGEKTVDLKPFIFECKIEKRSDSVNMLIKLPAGNTNNINPNLLIDKVAREINDDFYVEINRKMIYNSNNEEFK